MPNLSSSTPIILVQECAPFERNYSITAIFTLQTYRVFPSVSTHSDKHLNCRTNPIMLLIDSGAIAYLLLVTAILCRPISALGPGAGYNLFVRTLNRNDRPRGPSHWRTFNRRSDLTASEERGQSTLLLWTKSIQPGSLSNHSVSERRKQDDFSYTRASIYRYVLNTQAGIRLQALENTTGIRSNARFPFTPWRSERDNVSSSRDVCAPRYYCLMDTIKHGFTFEYITCLGRFNITSEQEDLSKWACGVEVRPYSLAPFCAGESWDLNKANWDKFTTDKQLEIALQGGVDDTGLYWKGSNGTTLAENFGRQFWNVNLRCTLASPCQHALDCSSVGSFTANLDSSIPYPSHWVYFATAAFVNINQQLRNQYTELGDAIESLALDTFSIDIFFPTKSQDFDLSNSLAGLSGIFSILGGFVPVAGPFISAAGTIASGVGTFLENSVAADSDDPLAAQRIFSKKVLFYYNASLVAMDNLVTKLFLGEPIPAPGSGSFTLLDMMKGGNWVNPNTLTNVSSLNEKIRREILARSIDSLWKSRTEEKTIKMWVLFTDLSNDPDSIECAQSKSCHSQLVR